MAVIIINYACVPDTRRSRGDNTSRRRAGLTGQEGDGREEQTNTNPNVSAVYNLPIRRVTAIGPETVRNGRDDAFRYAKADKTDSNRIRTIISRDRRDVFRRNAVVVDRHFILTTDGSVCRSFGITGRGIAGRRAWWPRRSKSYDIVCFVGDFFIYIYISIDTRGRATRRVWHEFHSRVWPTWRRTPIGFTRGS